jgi:crotonobetainyl-CoA:carnitine CoA-transferase CaiB-like acyl-CoA transferase
MLGFPMKFSNEPCEATRPAPCLGQHGVETLEAAGYDAKAIAVLLKDGVLVVEP